MLNKVSVSGDLVVAINVGVTDCHAMGAAACRWTAEPTPSPPTLRESRDLPSEVMSLLFWHKTHAQNVLTSCTKKHGV